MQQKLNIADVFIGRARRYNTYQEGVKTKGRKCIKCLRWQFSYPYTCTDFEMYSEKAETCINWTDDRNCKVD